MNPRPRTRSRSGIARILEGVVAAVIIFIVFSAATFLVQTSDVKVLQERGDLDRLGYNVLSNLIESGVIETIETNPVFQNNPTSRDLYLRTSLLSYLPITVYFNFTLFNCTDLTTYVMLQTVTNSVSNAPSQVFTSSTEVSSTDTIYTAKSGNIYYAVLLLARAGGGS